MADKFITLHPNNNGTLDNSTNVYPNIKASQNILRDNGTKMEVQEKLVSGSNIKTLKVGSNAATAQSLLGSSSIVIDLLNLVYPIGSIFTCDSGAIVSKDASDNPICPIQTSLGGSWLPIYDTFLYAAAKGTHVSGLHDYYPGDIGGSKDAIIPYHNHIIADGTGQHTHVTSGAKKTNATTTDKDLTGSLVVPGFLNNSGNWPHVIFTEAKGVFSTSQSGSTKVDAIDDVVQSYDDQYPQKLSLDATHVHQIASSGGHTHTINYAGTSGNTVGANMPPYKAVYAWIRIS